MRFAEVFLRLGSGLVAWMVLYAHFLWLAALYAIGCGPDGDEMHRLLLGLVPITCAAAFVLRVTRPFAEIHSMLRWLGVPLLLLLPFAIRSVWYTFRGANLEASAICTSGPPTTWQLAWSPLQAATVVVVSYMVIKVWRTVARDKTRDVTD